MSKLPLFSAVLAARLTGERTFAYALVMATVDQFNKIVAFYDVHKRMPSYQEIMSLVKFRSKASVFKLVNRGCELGYNSQSDISVQHKLVFKVPGIYVADAP